MTRWPIAWANEKSRIVPREFSLFGMGLRGDWFKVATCAASTAIWIATCGRPDVADVKKLQRVPSPLAMVCVCSTTGASRLSPFLLPWKIGLSCVQVCHRCKYWVQEYKKKSKYFWFPLLFSSMKAFRYSICFWHFFQTLLFWLLCFWGVPPTPTPNPPPPPSTSAFHAWNSVDEGMF